ncbi:carbamoyltransferase HypF [Fundidesulfovibrio butyratiphilus]
MADSRQSAQRPLARRRHVVTGRVQGVGFRPFVYRLAKGLGLTGFVQNAPQGVIIEVQGPPETLDAFARDLIETLPPLALIVEHSQTQSRIAEDETAFAIRQSLAGSGHSVLVSPDIATCPDCLADMSDPHGRRFDYPFTNCTNCGPRYTITKSVPYDRATTSMACFPLCPHCAAEYENPEDRRFHAQPNACPVCGPALWLTDASGREIARSGEALDRAAELLAGGSILAVKGLGGFHLACHACDPSAVAELRRRKHRPSKPLAVMAPSLEEIEILAQVDDVSRELLEGRQRPIVLCPARPNSPLSPEISPDTDLVGVMLPYTPLHHLLLRRFKTLRGERPAILVMTSANVSSEPIVLGNREALARLAGLADAFVLHNRDILVRTDDSVVRSDGADFEFFRRARGYTPQPVFLPAPGACVLGVGPELKNTVCLTKGDQAFLSQHVGDMQNLETGSFHAEVIDHLRNVLRVQPELVVADLHPDYLSTHYALESGLPVARLQHHYAHIFAALAENRLMEPVIGLALDGSGHGEDSTVWGGEFLYVDPARLVMKRAGHLSPVRLPGGEAAIRHPWRMAQAYFHALGRTQPENEWTFLAGHEQAAALVATMLDKGINSPQTTSCGRLFDAVSALLGLCASTSYEGQAAVLLEQAQDFGETGYYPCFFDSDTSGVLVLDTRNLFAYAARDFSCGVSPGAISRRFHAGLARGLADMALRLARDYAVSHVALSGGVFHNRTLRSLVVAFLRRHGVTPVTHHQTPSGDGCLSLGQAYYGQRTLAVGQCGYL